MSRGWIDAVVSKLDPKPRPLDPVTANGLIEIHNLMREAKGLPPETPEQWMASYVPLDPAVLAQLIDQAKAQVAAEEAELLAELRAEQVPPSSGTPGGTSLPRNSELERNSARNSSSAVPFDTPSSAPCLRVVDQHVSGPSHDVSRE